MEEKTVDSLSQSVDSFFGEVGGRRWPIFSLLIRMEVGSSRECRPFVHLFRRATSSSKRFNLIECDSI